MVGRVDHQDVDISGAKDRHSRLGLNALLNGVARRDIDIVAGVSPGTIVQ
jgi:hypothetical protein